MCCKVQLAICNTENHSTPSKDSFTSPAPHNTLCALSIEYKHDAHSRPKIDLLKMHDTQHNNYLCTCSLAWWHPTAVKENTESKTLLTWLHVNKQKQDLYFECWVLLEYCLTLCRHWHSSKTVSVFHHTHLTSSVLTYKAWAVVAEGGLHVRVLLEVVDEPKPQFGADDTGPHEIGRDLISTDEALPAHTHIHGVMEQRN